jgi:lanosterol synthase
VIVRSAAGRPIDEPTRRGLVRHFEVTRASGGGWGLHPESHDQVFVTTLVYVALRLLGVDRDDTLAKDARGWLREGSAGALANPTWGKFWLAALDLYEWSGVTPCPPELFLLPRALPFHPARYYCHTRAIYLAMAYLYGRRFRADLGAMRALLRDELYGVPYTTIDFAAHREDLAASDVVARPRALLRGIRRALAGWERVCPAALRRRALARCFDLVVAEQRASAYYGLSPVNGLLNCLALLASDPGHPELEPSLHGLEAWRWQDEHEGVRYAGARSNAWDTAFAMRALLAAPEVAARATAALRRAGTFLRESQMTADIPHGYADHRDPALGGWCFSDGAHRWPVSDCTAEAVVALLGADEASGPGLERAERLSAARLGDAVAFILSRQNADGGFATYERRRGPAWLDALNPSEMFRDCMTERSYVECTGSAIAALARARAADHSLATQALARAIERGVRFLRGAQRGDGSVPGFWGINFTYGIFHFVKGLRGAGAAPDDPALTRAAGWLVTHQRADGGWGEHHTSCLENRYVEHAQSQAVMTAWALLALIEVLGPEVEPVRRGIAWLIARQEPGGGWPAEAVNGVFFGSAMLDYRLYRHYFPLWALARFTRG